MRFIEATHASEPEKTVPTYTGCRGDCVNFTIHLPDLLVEDLDAFAQAQSTSRSGVIREAVREYLARGSRALDTRAARKARR